MFKTIALTFWLGPSQMPNLHLFADQECRFHLSCPMQIELLYKFHTLQVHSPKINIKIWNKNYMQ